MREQPPIDVPPWALPLLVVAITVPIAVAWIAAGPFFGIIVAGLVAATVAVVAIRLGSEPPRRRGRTRRVAGREEEEERRRQAGGEGARSRDAANAEPPGQRFEAAAQVGDAEFSTAHYERQRDQLRPRRAARRGGEARRTRRS